MSRSISAARASVFALTVTLFAASCAQPTAESSAESPAESGDPRDIETLLPGAAAGWQAVLVHDNGDIGTWTVEAADVSDAWGGDEVVALDDVGICWLLVPYSGRWTAMPSVHDGKWLGALAVADLDSTVAGREIYVGGERGNLYQVVPHPQGGFDVRLLHWYAGEEVHTIVAGQFAPNSEEHELLVFTAPGAMDLMRFDANGAATTERIGELPGRIRDAVVLPAAGQVQTRIATVSRTGELELWRLSRDGWDRFPMPSPGTGLGRLAAWPGGYVLFAAADDGRVLRYDLADPHAQPVEIWNGGLGLRGIVVAELDGDSTRPELAVTGYDGKVLMLSQDIDGAWHETLLFEEPERNHWLDAGELDGRNATRELLFSGYGGRTVMLRRTR